MFTIILKNFRKMFSVWSQIPIINSIWYQKIVFDLKVLNKAGQNQKLFRQKLFTVEFAIKNVITFF